jgi:hypothetical protein
MQSETPPDNLSLLTAEEVLRTIYGDDLKGCTVSLETVATIIAEASKQRERQSYELLNLYEKVVEAVRVLSTPPDKSKITTPDGLQTLLIQRLDTIHEVAQKTIQTTASFQTLKQKPQS